MGVLLYKCVLYFVSAKQDVGYFEHNKLIAVRLPSDLVG